MLLTWSLSFHPVNRVTWADQWWLMDQAARASPGVFAGVPQGGISRVPRMCVKRALSEGEGQTFHVASCHALGSSDLPHQGAWLLAPSGGHCQSSPVSIGLRSSQNEYLWTGTFDWTDLCIVKNQSLILLTFTEATCVAVVMNFTPW